MAIYTTIIRVAPLRPRFITRSNKSTEPITATMKKKDHASVASKRNQNSKQPESTKCPYSFRGQKERASTQIID